MKEFILTMYETLTATRHKVVINIMMKIFPPCSLKLICKFWLPEIGHMCWLTPGLLENVTGVIGILLSPLSGRLFRDFREMQWKDSAMKEWKKLLQTPFSDGWLVGWKSPRRFKKSPMCSKY